MLKKVVIHLKNDFKKKKNFRPRKKNLFYGPDRPLFLPICRIFFLLKIIVKSAIFRVIFFPKKMQAIFKHFSGHFGKKNKIKKKIHPTERPLFGICSPVEQGFFFLALFIFIYFIFLHQYFRYAYQTSIIMKKKSWKSTVTHEELFLNPFGCRYQGIVCLQPGSFIPL